MKDNKIASILDCYKHERISMGNAIDDINFLFGQAKVLSPEEEPIKCLDYLQGYLRCEKQCRDCKKIN
jgi:hypothetical protein